MAIASGKFQLTVLGFRVSSLQLAGEAPLIIHRRRGIHRDLEQLHHNLNHLGSIDILATSNWDSHRVRGYRDQHKCDVDIVLLVGRCKRRSCEKICFLSASSSFTHASSSRAAAGRDMEMRGEVAMLIALSCVGIGLGMAD